MRIGNYELPDLPPRYRSRKLWCFLVAWGSGTAFFALGSLPSTEWVELTKWAFGLYAFANAGQHVLGKPKSQEAE